MEQMHVDMLMNREAQTVTMLVYITNVKSAQTQLL